MFFIPTSSKGKPKVLLSYTSSEFEILAPERGVLVQEGKVPAASLNSGMEKS
jgi:hypothetical protein